MKYHIQTFGCQMNYSDSERIASMMESLGYEHTPEIDAADFLIFNTCSVKQQAEDRVLGMRRSLANLKKKKKDLLIALTGCMARHSSTQNSEDKRDQLLRRMPELDIIFKIDELVKLPVLAKEANPNLKFLGRPKNLERDPIDESSLDESSLDESSLDESSLANYFRIAPKKNSKAQVLVPIMTGCDKFCTYCIVPFSRGREKSRDFDEIIKECKKHVKEGAIEITLIGQTVNSYGLSFHDKKFGKFEKHGSSPFAKLLKEIDKLHASGLRRLRFMSPHPRDFSDELIATLGKLKTACPYIHMPVQSGDDEVLRRMNRNYKVAEYKEIMQKIRKTIPGCAITTDIIVGFCGETDAEFEHTYRMYEEMEWDMCFLSRYSPRKGTYSERKLTDDITHGIKAQRWHRLNESIHKASAKSHAIFLGKTVEVLVEKCEAQKDGTHSCSGRTPHYKEVFFSSEKDLIGKLVQVKITKTEKFYLEGELL